MPRASRSGFALLGWTTMPPAGAAVVVVVVVLQPVWVWSAVPVSVVCAYAAVPPIRIAIAKAAALIFLLPFELARPRGRDCPRLRSQLGQKRTGSPVAPAIPGGETAIRRAV